MRSAENMRACADGIEAMGREEAAYWLGMAMHRKNPRRVLFALRTLLTEPQPAAVTGDAPCRTVRIRWSGKEEGAMASATITAKGQTTIPKAVRDRLHLEPGDRVEFVVQEDGTALMIPATLTLAELRAAVPPPPRALSLEEMDEAVRARAAERAGRR